MARDLAKAGAAVAVVARSEDQLIEVLALIEGTGGRAIALPADVTDQQAVGKISCDVFAELNFSRCNDACMKIIEKRVGDGRVVEVPDENCPHFDHVYPSFDKRGKLREAILILKHDVSREGTGEPAIEAGQDDSKDVTLATIYHDLAAPLQVIRACSDVITMEVNECSDIDRDVIRDMLEASKRNERRLYEMVRTIRMISSLEENEIYKASRVQPGMAVGAVCSDYRLLLRDDTTLECDTPSGLPEVIVDPKLLDRVLFNLLDNAARYAKSGGRIVLSAHRAPDDACVTLTVFDDGQTIPEEFQSRLFEKHVVLDPEKRISFSSTRQEHPFLHLLATSEA